jgi:Type I phosphodiesterase / nucleotide pyrophosphatase/Aldehyde dehydrogenase family
LRVIEYGGDGLTTANVPGTQGKVTMANADTHANANAGGRAIAVNGRRYLLPSQPTAVVCVDGCEFDYLEAAAAARVAPFIGKMLKGGSAFKGDCVIPSFTNPNNLSIGCGVPPLVHGICGNYFEQAAPLAVQGSYKNSGQRCTAVERMLVQQRVAGRGKEAGVVVRRSVRWSK